MNYIHTIFRNDYFYGFFFISVLAILFFLPVVIGSQSLFEAYPVLYEKHNFVPPQIKTPWVIDGSTHVRTTVPTTRLAVETLKSGHVPLWSPYDGAGENLLLGGLHNPIRLIFFTVFDSLRAFDWAIILRFVVAGFGMFLFLHELGLSRRAALFGGVGYMFSGYFFVFLTYFFLDIEALSPWVLFGIERYFKNYKTKKILYAIFPGVLYGLLITGGQPQSVILHTFLIGGYALSRFLTTPDARKDFKLHVKYFAILLGVALLVALPYVIDFLTLFSQSFTIYDYGPFIAAPHGLEAASPLYFLHLFVNPSSILEIAIGGHVFNQFMYIVPYVAVTFLLLFLLSFFIKEKPQYIYFFYIFIGLALLKIFGFPFVQWIGTLPIFDKIGYHKLYGPIALCVGVVAAYVFHELPRVSIAWKKFFIVIGAIAFVFVVMAFAVPDIFFKSYTPDLDFLSRRPETISLALRAIEKLPSFLESFALKFIEDGRYFVGILFGRTLLFVFLALFLMYRVQKSRKQGATLFLLFFLIFELWIYMPKIRDGFQYFNPYVKPPFVEFLEARSRENHFATISTGYTFPVSLGDLFHIRKFQTTSAVFPKRFWQFVPLTIQKNDHDYFKLNVEDIQVTPPQFFDAANIQYLVTEAEPVVGQQFKLVYDDDLAIYENINVLPRAYVVFEKKTAASPDEARAFFYKDGFDPHTSVILEDAGAVAFSGVRDTEAIPAEITSYSPDEVIIRTNTAHDGVLVLSDAFYTAWRASVDGVPVIVYPANVLFRGIYLPEGKHDVRFYYAAPWYWPGILISLCVVLGTFVAMCVVWWKKSRVMSQ